VAQKALLPYLADPNQSTCLVLTAEKLDSRTKFAQALKKQAEVVQFWKLFDNDVPRWIMTRAKQQGYSMSAHTATELMEFVGNDLRQLDNELKKIIAYTSTKEITSQIVQQVVGDIRERDIFELVDAVGGGKVIDALRILNQLLIEGEQPLKILAMMTRQFRLLWKLKATLVTQRGLSARQLAGIVGVSPRSVEQLQRQVKRFSQVQLKNGMRRLYDVDRGLKSSANSPKILLEEVVIDLCVPEKAA
jgi:DNA polymerase-3 subunit delta